jgi:hypothetical protein
MPNEEPSNKPEHFTPHANLSDEVNHNIAKSEVEGGVWLKDCPVGTVLSVRTKYTAYTLDHRAEGWFISGHVNHCPVPVPCAVVGSTWGGSMIKLGFIGRGMRLEIVVQAEGMMTTSTIQEITEIK